MLLDISHDSGVLLDRGAQLTLDRVSFLELSARGAAGAWQSIPPDLPTGSHWVIPLGSMFPISAGAGVVYLLNGFDDEEIKIAFPVPRDLRVLKMNLAATVAPGSGESFTYALRRGNAAGASFSDAGLSVVISGSEVEDEADGSIDFVRGERLDVKLTKSSGVPQAWHVGGLEIQLL